MNSPSLARCINDGRQWGASSMRMVFDGIPVLPRSYLVISAELAKPLIETLGDKSVCVMEGHGITVTGETVEEATVRALNFNALASATLQVAQSGRAAPTVSLEDVKKLPDLGSTFHDTWVWRYYARKLKEEDLRLSRTPDR